MRILGVDADRPSKDNYTQSLLYVWRIADFEARQVGAAQIEPCHCLLSIWKIVDVDLTTIDFGDVTLADRDKVLGEMLEEANCLRKIYDLCRMDARIARKAYRVAVTLPEKSSSLESGMLHRSDVSRKVFAKAKKLAGSDPVRPVHLLFVLLELKAPLRDQTLQQLEVSLPSLAQATLLEVQGTENTPSQN